MMVRWYSDGPSDGPSDGESDDATADDGHTFALVNASETFSTHSALYCTPRGQIQRVCGTDRL